MRMQSRIRKQYKTNAFRVKEHLNSLFLNLEKQCIPGRLLGFPRFSLNLNQTKHPYSLGI